MKTAQGGCHVATLNFKTSNEEKQRLTREWSRVVFVLPSLSVPSSVPREPLRVKSHSLRITPDEKLASHDGNSSNSIKQRKRVSCFSVHASKTRGSNDPTINASVLTSRTESKSTILHMQRR